MAVSFCRAVVVGQLEIKLILLADCNLHLPLASPLPSKATIKILEPEIIESFEGKIFENELI